MKKTIQYCRSKLSLLTHKLIIKVILICLLISIIPVGIFSYISYHSTLEILINEYIKSNQKTLNQGSKVIENHFRHLRDIATSPYKDIPFLLNLSDNDSKFLQLSYNESFLKDMFFYSNDIDSIYFYACRSGILYYYSKRYSGNQQFKGIENETWYQKTVSNENGLYVSPLHNLVDYIDTMDIRTKPVYSIHQAISNLETKEVLGVITLNISEDTIREFSRSLRNEDERILILNPSKEILYNGGLTDDIYSSIISNTQVLSTKEGFLELDVHAQKYIVIYSYFFNDMFLAKVISYSQFEKDAISSISRILKSAIIIFFVILVFSVLIILKLNSLVRLVEENMEKISRGDLDIRMSYSGTDEIAGFINNFNDMAMKLNDMINSEYKSKIALKNAQILALQTQINPHFMYNSLQAASTLALRSNSVDTYKILNAIANLLKYSLGREDSMVFLETEIEHMQNYLHVQKARFGADIRVEYNLDDGTSEVKVPRLILQPLVENSLVHGTVENGIVNIIKVETGLEDGFCRIVVEDNGKGIDAEVLRNIKSLINDKDYLLNDENHIGLQNVIRRLRLIYNDQARIQIESKLNEGTRIVILIPFS